MSHPTAPSGALREQRGRRLASSRWESDRRVRDCLVADYEADEVFWAAALLGQLLEQHECLPRHARRCAPADVEPDGRLCRVAVSDPVGFRR